jgi:hypothetical protein
MAASTPSTGRFAASVEGDARSNGVAALSLWDYLRDDEQ